MRRVLPLLAVLSLAFAPLPFPKQKRAECDPARLRGSWFMDNGLEARFEEGSLTFYDGGVLVSAYRMTLDPAAEPKEQDDRRPVEGGERMRELDAVDDAAGGHEDLPDGHQHDRER